MKGRLIMMKNRERFNLFLVLFLGSITILGGISLALDQYYKLSVNVLLLGGIYLWVAKIFSFGTEDDLFLSCLSLIEVGLRRIGLPIKAQYWALIGVTVIMYGIPLITITASAVIVMSEISLPFGMFLFILEGFVGVIMIDSIKFFLLEIEGID